MHVQISLKQHHHAFPISILRHISYLINSFLEKFWKRAEEGGRKSFRFEEVDTSLRITRNRGFLVAYLDALQKDLERREELAGQVDS